MELSASHTGEMDVSKFRVDMRQSGHPKEKQQEGRSGSFLSFTWVKCLYRERCWNPIQVSPVLMWPSFHLS